MSDWLAGLLWSMVILGLILVSPIGYLIMVAVDAYRAGPEQGKRAPTPPAGEREEPAGGWMPGEAYPRLAEMPRSPQLPTPTSDGYPGGGAWIAPCPDDGCDTQ